jgi:hypothetical protein
MFGLILFFIFYSIFSIALGFVIFVALKLILLIQKKESGHAKDIIYTPIKMAPYFLIAIFINAFICEYVRKIDPPLSDYWSLPLTNGLALGAIDEPSNWSLWPSPDGGEAIISNVTAIAFDDKAIYGTANENQYFIYHIEPNRELEILSEPKLKFAMNQNGKSIDSLVVPLDYYHEQRNMGDLISLLIILCYPVFRLYKSISRILK